MEDTTPKPSSEATLARLQQLRQQVYDCFLREADALQDLQDALLSETAAQSLVQLSLSPFFTRKWPSIYQALSRGKIDEVRLQQVLVSTVLETQSEDEPLWIAVDATPIPRPDAETSEDRGYIHLPNLPLVEHPIGVGWQYSKVVLLPNTVSSWVPPLDVARIPTEQKPIDVAIAQLRRLRPLLGNRRVIVVADRGYCSPAFLRACRELGYNCLVRMKSDRKLFRPGVRRHTRGPVPKDGPVFQGKHKETHGESHASIDVTDKRGRILHIRRFDHLHFKQDRDLALHVVQVSRAGAPGSKRDPQDWWLVTLDASPDASLPSIDPLPLETIPEKYALRFSIEHGIRFEKQDLLWTAAHIHTPEQFDRWTWLLSTVLLQLYLARDLGQALHHPWEAKNRPVTPAQVRRVMPLILPQLGTPARPLRPRGISPGRRKGERPPPAKHFPVVRKHPKKKKKPKQPKSGAA